jgi:hypothetical protein
VNARAASRAEPKNRDGGIDLGQRLEGIHELGHDAEDAPRVFADEIVVAHAGNIIATADGNKRGKNGFFGGTSSTSPKIKKSGTRGTRPSELK